MMSFLDAIACVISRTTHALDVITSISRYDRRSNLCFFKAHSTVFSKKPLKSRKTLPRTIGHFLRTRERILWGTLKGLERLESVTVFLSMITSPLCSRDADTRSNKDRMCSCKSNHCFFQNRTFTSKLKLSFPIYYFVQWPTNAQLIDKLPQR